MDRQKPKKKCWTASEIGEAEWRSYSAGITKLNLFQSWEYGEAKSLDRKLEVSRFVILDLQDKPRALFQVLLRRYVVIGVIARLNRGPLFLSGDVPAAF